MKFPALVLAILAPAAFAQNADDYRGGWRTDGPGVPRTYEFSIRGEAVRGIYCTWCADIGTLAFVDGKFDKNGLSFTVTHVDNNGKTTFTDKGTAKFEKPNLTVTVTLGGPKGSDDTGKVTWTMIKDVRGPDPLPIPILMMPPRDVPVTGGGGGGGRGPGGPGAAKGPGGAGGGAAFGAPGAAKGGPGGVAAAKGPGPAAAKGPAPGGGGGGRGGYTPPGPYPDLTPDMVVGAWVGFGNGPDKQYFQIKKVGNKLRGMVCGRCDNPYTLAALDDFSIEGKVLHFNILHDDWGDYSIPFEKHVSAVISGNEMRTVFYQDNLPPDVAARGQNKDPMQGGTVLLGPLLPEATQYNHWRPPDVVQPRY